MGETVFQGFLQDSQNKFAEMQEGAQREGTILSVARVYEWIVTGAQDFADNPVCCEQRQKVYSEHYSVNLLEAINQLPGTARYFVQFQEPA